MNTDPRRTFYYRGNYFYFQICFLTVFVIFWFGMVHLMANSGGWMNHRQLASPPPSSSLAPIQYLVGLFILAVDLFLILLSVNARIEVENDRIAAYDCLNRLKAQGTLQSFRSVGGNPNSLGNLVIVFTEGGKLTIPSTMGQIRDLRARLKELEQNQATNNPFTP
jgi:hypothetical protein